MPKAESTQVTELEAIRRRVAELEDECADLRAENEELRLGKLLVSEQGQAGETLADIFDSLPEGFLYFDPDDRLVLVNSRIAEIYPLAAEVFVLGVSYETCMRTGVAKGQWGPDAGEDKEEWIQARLDYHANPVGVFEFNLPDGRCIRVEEKKTPKGGVVGMRTDITDLKEIERQLRESQERFSALFENSPAAIYLKDEKERYVLVSKQFENDFGVTSEEVIGKRASHIFPKEIAESLSSHDRRVLSSGKTLQEEVEIVYKDGSPSVVLMTKFPIYGSEGKVAGVAGINLDFTERNEMERIKHEFISIASHELRTPLTSLMGALGLIKYSLVGEISEEVESIIAIAYRNSERLSRLIDDILSIEKLDAGKLEYSMQTLSVPSLINQAVSEHTGYGVERDISFVVDGDLPDVVILGDEDRLMQVFSNLMSNAVKFSPNGTVVRLSAFESGQDVRISISDEGTGIPEEFQDKVFDKFSRANSTDTGHHGGTGLGLSIAKAVIEQHGGDLGFTTEADVGTTFFLIYRRQTANHEARCADDSGMSPVAMTSRMKPN
jgi:PAS domain S-box-containing protein